jgi:hypothetical protein
MTDRYAELTARLEALEATVAQHSVALGRVPPSQAVTDVLRTVWDASPLAARLTFVRGVLPADHPRQSALTEAAGLVELAASPEGFNTWITGYPALFADASAKLATIVAAQPDDDADALAREVLAASRERIAAVLAAAEVTWVAPRPGEPVGGECEVLGEAPSAEIPAGAVHTLKRPGFRRRGKLELRAQVLRSAPVVGDAPLDRRPLLEATPPPPAEAGEAPDWLRDLHQRASTGAASTLTTGLLRLAAAPAAARERELRRALEPLLPLLGAGWSSALADVPADWLEAFARQRPRLEAWLRDELAAELLVPREGQPFDPETMEATAERRTAHAHERGKVAKVHCAGLRSGQGVLIRAQVSRYSAGGLS